MADAPPPKPDRNLAIDAVKGVGILEVVVHHSMGQCARLFAHKGDWAWLTMRTVAWGTNFAIPLFLLLSAMLLTGSLMKSPDVGRFVWRRTSRTVWPYLAWSLIYWLLRLRTNPATFSHPAKLAGELLSGKAEYHLYFMVILIQLSIALPFVAALLRSRSILTTALFSVAARLRGRPLLSNALTSVAVRLQDHSSGFGAILLLSGGLQIGAFLLNRVPLFNVASPGSLLTWYVPSLFVGVWITQNREAWNEAWRREWPLLTFVAVVAGVAFTVLSIRTELRLHMESLSYNSLSVLFRVGASLALLGAAVPLAATRVGPLLAALGRYSLPIYLVHPIFLKLLGGPHVGRILGSLPLPAVWTVLVVTAASYLFGWLASWARLDLPLFGQVLPRRDAAMT